MPSKSLPIRGAWIEIVASGGSGIGTRSLPIRGAWIEMSMTKPVCMSSVSRSPSGERGLKYTAESAGNQRGGRSPSGERGLKYLLQGFFKSGGRRSPSGERGLKYTPQRPPPSSHSSLPIRGAWIEMTPISHKNSRLYRRSPSGERGLKYVKHKNSGLTNWVAPHPGSVD